jgi:hypothetical protein
MNRRGFMSMLCGAAGAPFVPWRGLVEPLIVLPQATPAEVPYTYNWVWVTGGSGIVVDSVGVEIQHQLFGDDCVSGWTAEEFQVEPRPARAISLSLETT